MSKKQKNKQFNKKNNNLGNGPSLTNDLEGYFKHIEDKSYTLGKEFMQFRYKKNDWGYVRNESLEFFEEWLSYYINYCDVDILSGTSLQYQNAYYRELSRAPSEEHFYKQYNFFSSY